VLAGGAKGDRPPYTSRSSSSSRRRASEQLGGWLAGCGGACEEEQRQGGQITKYKYLMFFLRVNSSVRNGIVKDVKAKFSKKVQR
jgi:hypothetical protein